MFNKHGTPLKIIIYSLVAVFLYLLQSVPSFGVRFMDKSPELLLVLTICVAFHESETFAAYFGLAIGLLNDIVTDNVIGMSAILFMFTAYFISAMLQTMLRNFFLTYIFITLSATGIYLILKYLLSLLFLQELHFKTALISVILPKFLFTGVMAYPIYLIVMLLHKKLFWGGDGN